MNKSAEAMVTLERQNYYDNSKKTDKRRPFGGLVQEVEDDGGLNGDDPQIVQEHEGVVEPGDVV